MFLDHGSVPVAQVLDRMQIYVTRGASQQGVHETPSRQMLEDVFDTSDVDDIMETILQNGVVHEQRKI
jgi:ribosome maturation protein Sdo1